MATMLRAVKGTPTQGLVPLVFRVKTTTNGTIDTSVAHGAGIKSVTKTGSKTGRYDVVLTDAYQALLAHHIGVISAQADAAMTAAKAIGGFVRSAAPTAGTLTVQMARTDTFADAEVEDGATITVTLFLQA